MLWLLIFALNFEEYPAHRGSGHPPENPKLELESRRNVDRGTGRREILW